MKQNPPLLDCYDVCVYGGTSAAVIAAVKARRMGASVILVSPTKHLGGVSSGGLGFTDIGNEQTVGGLSREFFHLVWLHYRKPEAWKFEPAERFKNQGQHGPAFNQTLEVATVFEPHVAEKIFGDLMEGAGVPIFYGRLDLKNGVEKEGSRLEGLRLEDGNVISADQFIDATYEGDLMACAGVSYTIGREPNSEYSEEANGIQPGEKGNQLPSGLDPYLVAGDPSSGLLPRVNPDAGGKRGDGDKRIQAYCYRMCLTRCRENRRKIEQPANYREGDYEILFRAIEAGQKSRFFKFSALPNRKTDSNNDSGISTDYIGMNYEYPEGDYATRERIAEEHKQWQLGLIWTLQKHPRVPSDIRKAHSTWGLPKDEFTDNENWSSQLYVREARRLMNDHVMSESVLLARTAEQSAGMGSYKMDSHNVQFHVNEIGHLAAEGDIQKSINGPYQIDFRTMIPRKEECSNLSIPVCLAATHIAYGSIRMESVFMILSESAATAAVLASQEKCSIHDLSYDLLRTRLEKDGQVLA